QINPVFQKIDEGIVESRTKLAGLEQRKKQLVDVRRLDSNQLAELNRLYGVEARLSRLEMERELARKVYTEVATSYETARLQVLTRTADLQVIAPPVRPDRPISRNTLRNVVLGAIVGLLLASVAVL